MKSMFRWSKSSPAQLLNPIHHVLKSQLITESQNCRSWKGPQEVVESNPLLKQEPYGPVASRTLDIYVNIRYLLISSQSSLLQDEQSLSSYERYSKLLIILVILSKLLILYILIFSYKIRISLSSSLWISEIYSRDVAFYSVCPILQIADSSTKKLSTSAVSELFASANREFMWANDLVEVCFRKTHWLESQCGAAHHCMEQVHP